MRSMVEGALATNVTFLRKNFLSHLQRPYSPSSASAVSTAPMICSWIVCTHEIT